MGNNIKEVRKSKGITQKELAEKLGVTPQAVSQFEKNDSKKFNISTLQSIAAALDCSIKDLVDTELIPEINVRMESVKDSRDQRLISYLMLKATKLNRMGYDALANYLELLINTEKYTSNDQMYLREAWGDDIYGKFYPKEPAQFDMEVTTYTTDAAKGDK